MVAFFIGVSCFHGLYWLGCARLAFVYYSIALHLGKLSSMLIG